MKTISKSSILIAVLGTLGATAALAHEEYSEAGPYHWLSHVAERAQAQSAAPRQGPSARIDMHEEQTGGHTLHEVRTQKWSPEAARKERDSQKGTDRGKDNHEEGAGGHGLYEALKK